MQPHHTDNPQAANILMGDDGSCMLSDLGVATLSRRNNASSINLAASIEAIMHRTFVGTPCWIAPEVMEQASG